MKSYVAVAGTWGWRDRDNPDAWFQPTSSFALAMAMEGYRPLRPERPFLWTTRINGDDFWRRWLAPIIPRSWERGDTRDWEAAAAALVDYCETEILEEFGRRRGGPDVIIAHSHAGQVLAMAAKRYGLKVPRVITVSTPPREDLVAEYYALHHATSRWIHLHDAKADWIARLGMAGDGALRGARTMAYAHENVALDGVAHTGVLDDIEHLGLWKTHGWLA